MDFDPNVPLVLDWDMNVGPSAPAGMDLISAEVEMTASNETDTEPMNNMATISTDIERRVDAAFPRTARRWAFPKATSPERMPPSATSSGAQKRTRQSAHRLGRSS